MSNIFKLQKRPVPNKNFEAKINIFIYQERTVPATRLSRVLSFGSLGVGLGKVIFQNIYIHHTGHFTFDLNL